MITQVFRILDIVLSSKSEIQGKIDADEDGYETKNLTQQLESQTKM